MRQRSSERRRGRPSAKTDTSHRAEQPIRNRRDDGASPSAGSLTARSAPSAIGAPRVARDPWESFLGGLSAKTRRAYEGDIKQFFAFINTHPKDYVSISKLTPADIVAFQTSVSHFDPFGKLENAATVARKLSAIRQLLKWYRGCGVIDRLPSEFVRGPRVSRQSPRIGLTKEEARAIVDSIEIGTGKKPLLGLRDKAIIALMLRTGVRREEVMLIRRMDIYQSANIVAVLVHGKGDKTRSLPLHAEVQAAIAEYLIADGRDVGEPNDPLFEPTINRRGKITDKPLHVSTIHQIVKRAVRRAAAVGAIRPELVGKITPHSLRHTAITLALDAGAKLERVQIMAGHANPATTIRYFRSAEDLKQSAINYIDF
jgi:integrase/recombinase XerD